MNNTNKRQREISIESTDGNAWLQAHGFDRNLRSRRRRSQPSPISVAIRESASMPLFKWLFENGAPTPKSLISDACIIGRVDILAWLHEECGLTLESEGGSSSLSPMALACLNGHLAAAKYLFSSGAVCLQKGAPGNLATSFERACSEGHLSIVQWLVLTAGVSSEFNDVNSLTLAWEEGHIHVAQWLVLHGALNERATGSVSLSQLESLRPQLRSFLVAWSTDAIKKNSAFIQSVLIGTLSRQPREICLAKLSGMRDALQLIADFAGVLHGRHYKTAREINTLMGSVSTVDIQRCHGCDSFEREEEEDVDADEYEDFDGEEADGSLEFDRVEEEEEADEEDVDGA